MSKIHLTLTVNGEPREALIDPRRTLLDTLRNHLELRGVHRGCDTGNCGACTVILDGKLVTACMVLAADCEGADVLTIEGVAPDGQLHPVQRALVEAGGIQCGYCTPGMVMAAVALLDEYPQRRQEACLVRCGHEHPHPSEADVRMGLAGNLCRCTGYKKILEAVLAAGAVPGVHETHRLHSGDAGVR